MTKEIVVDEEKEREIKKSSSKDEMQQKVLTYRILQSHLEQLKKDAELIERKYIEVEATKQFLNDAKDGKKDTEILLPVGAGIFAKGKLTDKKLLFDIGSGVMVNKSNADVEAVVENSIAEIESAVKKLNKEMQETVHKLNDLTSELQLLQQGG